MHNKIDGQVNGLAKQRCKVKMRKKRKAKRVEGRRKEGGRWGRRGQIRDDKKKSNYEREACIHTKFFKKELIFLQVPSHVNSTCSWVLSKSKLPQNITSLVKISSYCDPGNITSPLRKSLTSNDMSLILNSLSLELFPGTFLRTTLLFLLVFWSEY